MDRPKRILVAEDDEAVRETFAEMLTSLGYEVVAEDTERGREQLAENGEALDVIISHNEMLLLHTASTYPRIKRMLVSGDMDKVERFYECAHAGLMKPVRTEDFRTMIDDLFLG